LSRLVKNDISIDGETMALVAEVIKTLGLVQNLPSKITTL